MFMGSLGGGEVPEDMKTDVKVYYSFQVLLWGIKHLGLGKMLEDLRNLEFKAQDIVDKDTYEKMIKAMHFIHDGVNRGEKLSKMLKTDEGKEKISEIMEQLNDMINEHDDNEEEDN